MHTAIAVATDGPADRRTPLLGVSRHGLVKAVPTTTTEPSFPQHPMLPELGEKQVACL